jgi:hypothetical protein
MGISEHMMEGLELDSKPDLENEIFQHPISKNRRAFKDKYEQALTKFTEIVKQPKSTRFGEDNLVKRKAIEVQYNIL